jgi:UDP-N-acetylglucosamine--N-acetylmuramyl-(pentapeptide) pyrophosphoryl-undecaprenol N-acetylglucosamine transferase
LVPYPFAVDDHQTVNGNFLVKAGAGILTPQNEFTCEYLTKEFENLYHSRDHILKMSIAARALAKSDSAKTVANYCIEAAHGR